MSGESMAGCSRASQITPDFVQSLETQLKIQYNSLKDSIKEYETRNSMMSRERRLKCPKLKSMKQEVSNSDSKIKESKKTVQDLKRFSKELSEHTLLLKANVECYEKESIALDEEQNKCLEKAEAQWQIYKEKYEKRPAAVRLRKEEVELEKSKIELIVKRYKLAEKIKILAKLEGIHKKQRNDLATESATIWKEAWLKERKRHEALEKQKKLRVEIQKQEATIKDLMEAKREAMLKAQQKSSSIKNKGKRVADRSTALQFQRLKIPKKTMPRPMPNLRNDNSDNISICSALIDEMIESTEKPKETEGDKLDRGDSLSQRSEASQIGKFGEAGLMEKLNDMQIKASTEPGEAVNRCDSNSKDLRNVFTTEMQVENDAEIFEGDERVDRSMEEKKREAPKTIENKEERDILRRSQESINRPDEYDNHHRFNRGMEVNNDEGIPAASQEINPALPQREIHQGRNEIKQPIIRSIETVEFNLPLQRSAARIPKAVEEDSLSQFLPNDGELGSEFSWKRSNRPESLYMVGDSRRADTELDSILGSQISLQSEEMMKRFRLALDSPELGINKDEDSVFPNKNDRRADLSQTVTDDFTNNRSPTTASPFLGIGNYGSTPANRDREERFFMNMF